MICRVCKKTDAEGAEFYASYEHDRICKGCARTRQSVYNVANRASINAKMAVHFASNRVAILSKKKAERAVEIASRPPEPFLLDRKCFRCKQVKGLVNFHRQKGGLEGLATTCKTCRLANRAEWRKANPMRDRAICQRRRARLMNAPVNDFTPAQWETLKDQYDFCCLYCKRKFAPELLTQDHLTPLSRGGSHTMANIAPACHSCNCSKNDKTAPEYFRYLSA
jgi:hypothetical protein